MPDLPDELQKIDAALAAIEELRGRLPDEQIDAMKAPLLVQRNTLANQSGGVNVSADTVNVVRDVVGRDNITNIMIQQTPPSPKALSLPEALRHYLDNLIAARQHLRLQAIRTDQPLGVSLEKVYISLTAIDQWHRDEKVAERPDDLGHLDSRTLSIPVALARYRRLVIIGDPGSGKTTLLAYLALTYARTLRDGVALVQERLALPTSESLAYSGELRDSVTLVQERPGLKESDHLPILLPLRDFGRHLKLEHPDPGKDGPALLLNYLRQYYAAQNIVVPEDFFSDFLEGGKAVLLWDGLDEVADPALRQRVARLVEKFVVRYPGSRYVVTSRVVGYEGTARLGENFGLAKVQEFTPAEVRQFVRDWTRAVETALAGSEEPVILRRADDEADKLIHAIDGNPRIAELAVNPLLLTVIALVHRYRAALPEKRAELYEEAVEVLLGAWDKAKGLETEAQLAGRRLDTGDRRSLLEPAAFWLHEQKQRDIESDELRPLVLPTFVGLASGDKHLADKAVDEFLRVVNERSGLLVERGTGVYGFAHQTFQEYLAARALASRDDFVGYTINHLPDSWWREVILLEAGYLSTQGKRRVSELIRAIMSADPKTEPEPHHHLMLAAECLFDVGAARVEGDLQSEIRKRLKQEADAPLKKGDRAGVLRKVSAMNALTRIESGQFGAVSRFWTQPWGRPEWVTIPAGEFWMGDGNSAHRVFVPEYQIARVPVTNAQYALYVADAKVKPPADWRGGQPPAGKESHPVVNVSWHDALAYCRWLGTKIGRAVRLPTEAEWEKAARGDKDKRAYPWGDDWEELRCNSEELGLGDTSPVDLFLTSASLYGVLDMVGNVWERCQSRHADYPYDADDGREIIDQSNVFRVLRGGSFYNYRGEARCADRVGFYSDDRNRGVGVRVVVSPL